MLLANIPKKVFFFGIFRVFPFFSYFFFDFLEIPVFSIPWIFYRNFLKVSFRKGLLLNSGKAWDLYPAAIFWEYLLLFCERGLDRGAKTLNNLKYLLGVSAAVSFFGLPLACMMAFSKNATRPENRNYARPRSGFLEKREKPQKNKNTLNQIPVYLFATTCSIQTYFLHPVTILLVIPIQNKT